MSENVKTSWEQKVINLNHELEKAELELIMEKLNASTTADDIVGDDDKEYRYSKLMRTPRVTAYINDEPTEVCINEVKARRNEKGEISVMLTAYLANDPTEEEFDLCSNQVALGHLYFVANCIRQ